MDQAPRTTAVSAPLPEELRPYIVLHAERADLPAGSRFGGHWVNAWRCRLPFVQIDRARSHEVGRCVPFAGDGDPAAMRALLRDAACLISADETWLAEAAAAGTKTIYLADGREGAAPTPSALADFDPNRLRVLRSDTNFRRDLPLRKINEALEHFVPGVTGEDRSESSLCRDRLAPYMSGRIADLGHGGHKVHPGAVGVDFFKFDETDWIGDVRDLWFFESQSFDSVYSSHCLEDLWHPHQALEEWTRILRPGGHLSLFLPLRDFYPNVGTPDCNPGHRDDYVPEDVEGFLRELGHVEVVHSARVERENSFEVVAKKKAGRSYFMQRDAAPTPTTSVLMVADPSHDPAADAAAICASVAAALDSLAGTPYEVLVLDRTRSEGDARASVQDLAARDPRVHVVCDRRPLPYGARWELLRQRAVGETMVVLEKGALLTPGAADAMRGALEGGAAAGFPAACDVAGNKWPEATAASSCLWLRAERWAPGAFDATAYTTPAMWSQLAQELGACEVPTATLLTAAEHGRPMPARGYARRLFDDQLRSAGVTPRQGAACGSILVVMLRTLGDCVLATPTLSALRGRYPGARIEVLTERPYAWIFEQHAAVDAVLTTDGTPADQMFLGEDRAVATALEHRRYDRLVLLSDRLENVTYHHSGVTLADYYALQAGAPEACSAPPELSLAPAATSAWQRRRAAAGVDGPYAVVHTRAGWDEKTPSAALMERVVDQLAAAGLTPVVVGGDGEVVDRPAAVNLAGQLGMAESAAAIAGAALFVGPDSGPLHIASAFGVKSLALFGGSHLRVAPPRAKGSCAVQAATCCPVPCGITPCPERNCGAAGLAVEAVLPRLQALVGGTAGEDAEYWGEAPALCITSADGPVLVSTEAAFHGGRPAAPLTPATCGAEAPARAAAAPSTALPVELGMFALQNHARLVQSAAQPVGDVVGAAQSLEALRSSVTPTLGVEVLRAVLGQCLARSQTQAAVQVIGAAISHCGEMMRGERGRPRAAYKVQAGEMLHRAMHLPLPEPAGASLRLQLLELYKEETGAHPDCDHVLNAIAVSSDAEMVAEVKDGLRAMLHGCDLNAHAHHALVLRQASMMRRVGEVEGAAQLLDRHLGALAAAEPREVAQARFLRGTCCVASGRLQDALADMRFAAVEMESEDDRKKAAQIVEKLARHLGAAPTGA